MFIGLRSQEDLSCLCIVERHSDIHTKLIVGHPTQWAEHLYAYLSEYTNEKVEGMVIDTTHGSFTATRVITLFAHGWQWHAHVPVVSAQLHEPYTIREHIQQGSRVYATAQYSGPPRMTVKHI